MTDGIYEQIKKDTKVPRVPLLLLITAKRSDLRTETPSLNRTLSNFRRPTLLQLSHCYEHGLRGAASWNVPSNAAWLLLKGTMLNDHKTIGR
jgi:hypothetical protein